MRKDERESIENEILCVQRLINHRPISQLTSTTHIKLSSRLKIIYNAFFMLLLSIFQRRSQQQQQQERNCMWKEFNFNRTTTHWRRRPMIKKKNSKGSSFIVVVDVISQTLFTFFFFKFTCTHKSKHLKWIHVGLHVRHGPEAILRKKKNKNVTIAKPKEKKIKKIVRNRLLMPLITFRGF